MDIAMFIGPIGLKRPEFFCRWGQVVRPAGTSCQSCRPGFYFKEADGRMGIGMDGGLVAIFYFPINIGFIIIPIDFHIFQRGSNHQPGLVLLCFLGNI